MKTITLKGQFYGTDPEINLGVKLGKYAELDFIYDGKTFHPPEDYSGILDQAFGSDAWEGLEFIIKQHPDGTWYDCGDYGRSDEIIQLDRKAV
jgi:hypothetical protein